MCQGKNNCPIYTIFTLLQILHIFFFLYFCQDSHWHFWNSYMYWTSNSSINHLKKRYLTSEINLSCNPVSVFWIFIQIMLQPALWRSTSETFKTIFSTNYYVYDNVDNIYKSISNVRPQHRLRYPTLSPSVRHSTGSRASEEQTLCFSHIAASLPVKLQFFNQLRIIFCSDWLFPQLYSSHNCNQEKPLCVVPTEVGHL